MAQFETFTLKQKTVLFAGVDHTPDLQQIDEIRQVLVAFRPQVILVEGGFEDCVFESEDDAIQRGWEVGFVSHFAARTGARLTEWVHRVPWWTQLPYAWHSEKRFEHPSLLDVSREAACSLKTETRMLQTPIFAQNGSAERSTSSNAHAARRARRIGKCLRPSR